MSPRIKDQYQKDVVPALMKDFSFTNVMQVPKLEKIVVNMGLGEAVKDGKIVESAVRDLTMIAAQRPVVTRARRSIANFKLRAGMPIGCKVTLRGARMYEFYDRLVNFSIPRIRDFRGLSDKSFDGRGNYTMGIKDQLIFPEIEYDQIDRLQGMNITITTTASSDDEAKALLKHLGMPFRS